MSGAARFVANLHCEVEWTGGVALPARVLRRVAALGTLLRALTREGDRLWTPAPVDPERVPSASAAVRPRLETGDLTSLPDTPVVVPWGETRGVAAVRSAAPSPPGIDRSAGWRDRVRFAPGCPPSAARRVNHRAFCLAEQERLGLVLPGARWVRSPSELESHVRAGGAAASPAGRWVLKAPLAAAGRDRLRGGPGAVPGDDGVRLARLLARHGELLFEPWMERTADHGSLALVGPAGVKIVGRHRLEMSAGGALRAIQPLGETDTELSGDERRALYDATRAVGASLGAAGYAGPFGLDAYRFRDCDGTARYQPLCEINARLTFGFVARALAENEGWTPEGAEPAPTLYFGTRAGLLRAGDAARALLLPGGADAAAAWLR